MALIECPECGKKISSYAYACPECGCPMDVIEVLQKKKQEEELKRLEEEKISCEERKRMLELEQIKKQQEEEIRLKKEKQLLEEELANEEKKRKIQQKKELEQYEKYMSTLRVENFDFIKIQSFDKESEKQFRVNINKNPMDKQFIGLKYKQIFRDSRNNEWQIVDIKKNNCYEGLDEILPGYYIAGESFSGSRIRRENHNYDIRKGY